MKRVAVIAIFMAIMASLFAFNVFGETDFGYNVSVSNQDSINGVVITLKANRGSLVNSGTAALGYSGYCPVLITITVQNTNNQNVLINNLKFKLTTNSSGNFSRIVSFEQLSSDLIVAETPYDLNNYISIVPSAEYSFGTGIIVPANSSMYMVCIMNVYANYDTSSNQWQVPSLQYIGYDQNITVTPGDYNSTGVPVDLSSVVGILEDLIDTVSTSEQLDDLINALTYVGSNYQYSQTSMLEVGNVTKNLDGQDLFLQHQKYVFKSYLDNIDVNYNSGSDNTNVVGTEVYDIYYYLSFINRTNKQYSCYNFIQIVDLIPMNASVGEVDLVSSLFDKYSFHNRTSSSLSMFLYFSHPNGENGILNTGDSKTVLHIKLYAPIGSNLSFNNNVDVLVNGVRVLNNSVYYPSDEYSILRDLYLAYQNVNGLDDIDDTADDIKDKSESAHSQEQSYFTQNAQAIQQTGLSNYRFNGDQENGIGSVSHDFTLLWNALDGFNSIYIFSLTLSLALMILRHAPGVIRSSRRNKEE